jgi:hypothetical protein
MFGENWLNLHGNSVFVGYRDILALLGPSWLGCL